MKSLGTYGQGKSYIQFKWKELTTRKKDFKIKIGFELCAVKFKAIDRTQLALIIREFRTAQLKLRHSNGMIQNPNAARDLSFEYIAFRNPDCKIVTYQKNKKLAPYMKEYKFNWRIKGHVTIQQLQRIMKRKDAIK